MDVQLSDIQDYFQGRAVPCQHKHLLVACMPKSGSTYMTALIRHLPDFHDANLVGIYERREQELAGEQLLAFHHVNYVAQHHVRYHTATQKLMDQFSLFPIVLIRNLYDIVYSIHDHMLREGTDGPHAVVPSDMMRRPTEEILSFIVDMVLPWYFNFYCSWQLCPDKLMLRYENWTSNPSDTLRLIAAYSGVMVDDAAVQCAIEKAGGVGTRFNKGVTGRGRELPNELKERVQRFASYYRGQDLSDILSWH